MRRLFAIAAFVLVAAAPAVAQGQGAFVASGNYTFVMETGYAGPDLTGFTIAFGADSSWVINAPDGSLVVKSKLKWEGNALTILDQDGSNMCSVPGKYAVEGTPASFKLKPIDDACGERAAIVPGLRFVKQP